MSALGANLRSFLLPLTAAGLVPALLIRGDPGAHTSPALLAGGGVLFALGFAMLVWTVSLFIRIGRGTLAPWNPTKRLVVLGPFAHARNPMISGVACMIAGEALASASARVLVWAVSFVLLNHAWFLLVEEPGLVKRFGSEYETYARNVPRWIPRWKAWRPERAQ